MDRRHPLEKMKAENMEVTSKIMPKWMEINHKNVKKSEDFKKAEYIPIKQKAKRLVVFVDKELNPSRLKSVDFDPSRSVFNYGDFRNNVLVKKKKIYMIIKLAKNQENFLIGTMVKDIILDIKNIYE